MSKESEIRRRKVEFGWLPRVLYRINMDSPSQRRVEELAQMLVARPELSFVTYINHISYNDPIYPAHLIQRVDPEQTRKLIAPASYSHTSKGKHGSSALSFMTDEAIRCGIDIIRVIQTYQVDNPEYGFKKEEAAITYRNLVEKLVAIKTAKTPTGCIISPEGHRSENGQLGKAEDGILYIGKQLVPVVFVPMGIWYPGKYERNGINLGKRVNLSVGEMVVQETKHGGPTIETLMHNLALAIPPEMRGRWV